MGRRPGWAVAATAAAGVLVLGGCAGAEPGGGSSEKPTVLTTFTVLQDMTAAVAGDHVSVESITKPGAEIHDYEPTPQDVTKASRADLVLDNGLHLEQWLEQFTSSANVAHKVVSEGVEALDIADTPGTPNPHAWRSPRTGERYVDNIVTALSELDGEHARQFRDNGEKYKEQIRAIGTDLTRKLEALPRNERALVTCEGAFSYLARDTGLTEKYIWPVNAEQEATPQQVSSAIEFVDRHRVPAVFCESTVSDKPMQQVAEATGARYGGTLYVDSLSEQDGPVPTYLDLLRHDADTIANGLSGRAR